MPKARFPHEAEPRAMAEAGLSHRLIAKHFGVSEPTIGRALNAAMRARHAEYYRERRVREKEPDIMGAGADFQFIEPHVFRTIRRVIDRDAIRQILANREGGIPIDSLMARIGGAA